MIEVTNQSTVSVILKRETESTSYSICDCWTWTHEFFDDTFSELEQTIALPKGSL